MDLQEKIVHYGLEAEDETFRTDLARFGLVYDFAWDNDVTRNQDLFKDPYHFGNQVKAEIISTVWNNLNHHVRVYGNPTLTQGTPHLAP